jgi:hypothetical protein
VAAKDPYRTLGVKKNSTKDEIKKSYRAKAKKLHPDVGGDSSKFSELSSAYSLLMDDSRRSRYDQTGESENKSEDAVRNAALNVVGNSFISLVAKFGTKWKEKQVKQSISKDLRDSVTVGQDNLIKLEREIDFWESVKADVIFTGKEADPIGDSLDAKLRALHLEKETEKLTIKTMMFALVVLKNYDFKKPNVMGRIGSYWSSVEPEPTARRVTIP